jgi:DHA2 family multidrug resistance protein-like MFS transporter
VLLVIFGLKQFAENGLGVIPVVSVLTGLAIGYAFVQRQRHLVDPLIDLRLFGVREFSASLATYTLGIFVGFGSFLFVAQYLQLVLDLSPLQAGLWSVPGALAFIVGSNLAPRIVRRVRPAYVVAGGLALAGIGFGLLTQVSLSSLAFVVIANVLMSVGFGFAFTLTVDLVIAAAPPERAGAASAMAETGAELGGALGLAVLGSLGIAIYRSQVAANMPAGISPEMVESIKETLGAAVVAARQLPGEVGAELLNTARIAFVQALQVNAIIGVIGFTVLVILTATMLRHIQPHEEGQEHPEPEHAPPLATASRQPDVQMGD